MISVIVPVYNTPQKLLIRCIKSILSQTYTNFELILVDDGSKTNIANQIFAMKELDHRIVTVQQSNNGVSSARKKGLNLAKGDYICFVDADDTIEKDYLEQALCLLKQTQSNVVVGGIRFVYQNVNETIAIHFQDQTNYKIYGPSQKPYLLENLLTDTAPKAAPELKEFLDGALCGKFFDRNFIKSAYFNQDIYKLEDKATVFHIIIHAHTVCFSRSIWYNYYQYGKSALHSNDKGERLIHNYSILLREFFILIEQLKYPLWGAYYQFTLNLIFDIFRNNFNVLMRLKERNDFEYLISKYFDSDIWKYTDNVVNLNFKEKAMLNFLKNKKYEKLWAYVVAEALKRKLKKLFVRKKKYKYF